ncbi:MbnP family copper-binding protein [Thalassotalea marina]|uniref:Copper-binding protein MbnP-like domain-containing protein n=1 Tax=Thalassotalea marina TaxID=1673741 RepID=A0A919EGH5_9GAMM|nr:MbnP family copper-binding protein [Thalassotalea marina]GHF79901.1 hypothetical protein GCM10017161_03890 [Thalassotalea marina]
MNNQLVYTTLALVLGIGLVAGCSKSPQQHLDFKVSFGDAPLSCDSLIVDQQTSWQLSQFYLYLSHIEVKGQDQKWRQVSLADNKYQSQQVAMLGTECGGQEPAHWQLKFAENADINQATAIRFSLGVPFELNHQNPLTQASPLNVSNMFWVWQTGHKFVRFELENQDQQWVFHLGSTGCSSASALRSPSAACKYPNLYTVTLPLETTDKVKKVNLDIAPWFAEVKIAEQTSCQSAQDNQYCQQIFNNLAKSVL